MLMVVVFLLILKLVCVVFEGVDLYFECVVCMFGFGEVVVFFCVMLLFVMCGIFVGVLFVFVCVFGEFGVMLMIVGNLFGCM